MAGAQNQWVRRRNVKLANLMSEPWVLPPPESGIASIAKEAFRISGLNFLGATVFAVAPEIRISFLASGRFLTILPASVLKFPPRRPEIKVLRVELPVPRAPIGIVTLKNRTLNPVAELFTSYAREDAKPLAKKQS